MTDKAIPSPAERGRAIAETAYCMTHGRGLASEPTSTRIATFRTVDRVVSALMLERLETRATTTTKKLSALKHRVSTLSASARAAQRSEVQNLDALEVSLRSKLDELRKSSDKISERALHQAENVWNELSDALQRVTATAQR